MKPAANKGAAWTPADDDRLLSRLRDLDGDPERFQILASELQRTVCAITTRVSALKAGLRLAARRGSRINR